MSESLIIRRNGDIPFAGLNLRTPLFDRKWTTPPDKSGLAGRQEMHLEAVTLANGLPYAVIRNAQTGQEAFDYHESYPGKTPGSISGAPVQSARIIKETNLGNGFIVSHIIAGDGSDLQSRGASSSTYVDKKIKAPDGASHIFRYSINPHRESFHGDYTYQSGNEVVQIDMTLFTLTPDFEGKLGYKVFIADNSNPNRQSQVNLTFSNNGTLNKISLLRDHFNLGDANSEFSTLRRSSNEDWVTLEGGDLKSPEVKALIQKLLGVEYGDSLVIDTSGSLDRLLKNLDATNPANPRKLLAFVDAK